jgi:hypothetical protein
LVARAVQLTGFSDPVYAEAYVHVQGFDILLDVLIVNQTKSKTRLDSSLDALEALRTEGIRDWSLEQPEVTEGGSRASPIPSTPKPMCTCKASTSSSTC